MKKKLVFISVSILILLVFGCLYSDSVISQSKDVYFLNNEAESLRSEVNELELTLSKSQSLASVNSRARDLGMVEGQKIWYVKAAGSLSLR